MPQLFSPKTEAHQVRQIASYLFHTQRKLLGQTALADGNAQRGAELFTKAGCADCHASRHEGRLLTSTLKAPAFTPSRGLALRHFWTFDNNVEDIAGSNHGRVSGKTKYGKAATQTGSGSFEFDGGNFIELTHFHRPDVMTISTWIKTKNGGEVVSWGRPDGERRGSRELRVNIGQDGRNSICYGEYNSDGGWRPVVRRPTDVNLIDDQWHHIAVVRKGTDIQIYADGKAQGGIGKTQPGPGDYTDRFIIGALGLSNNPGNRFRGSIDDVSIWEMALSANQIRKLAAGESALKMARPKTEKVEPFAFDKGCLADSVVSTLPKFRLSAKDRTALRMFLNNSQPGHTKSQSPLSTLALRIKQFRCVACHELDDQNQQAAVRENDDGKIVRVERPPILTGVGNKLTEEWLNSVLMNHQRNRPWLKLRMPHFGASIAELPRLLAKSGGAPASDPLPSPKFELARAGLKTIGIQRGQVGCIACHNYRGINRQKDGVVPAPDLAEAAKTVQRDWFRRWMWNPVRIQPGTSMPQFYLELPPEKRAQKFDELWAALVHQSRMPLPDGMLKKQTEGTKIIVKNQPVIFRMSTKTPVGQIDRAINVGLPGGWNFCFDAASSRLRFAWKGDFIDAGPAWNGRGGNPVSAGGQALVKLGKTFPLKIGTNKEPSIRFRGYRLVKKHPVFRYEIDGKQIEHRVDLNQNALTQEFVIHKPEADVVFTGDSNYEYTSDIGDWTGTALVVANADIVKFTVTIKLAR